jgi:hypothetical protein
VGFATPGWACGAMRTAAPASILQRQTAIIVASLLRLSSRSISIRAARQHELGNWAARQRWSPTFSYPDAAR